MSLASTSAVFGRRTCAALAACSAILHGAMVGRPDIATVLTLTMAAACLYCAYELWTRGSISAWLGVAVMNLVMIGAHLSAPGHQHGGPVQIVAAPSTLMTVATGLAVVEAVIAAAVLYARTREATLVLLRQ